MPGQSWCKSSVSKHSRIRLSLPSPVCASLDFGVQDGYAVLVLNSNQNVDVEDKRTRVRGSENPENHFLYVWDSFVKKAKAKYIGIVAHSYGGAITVDGLREIREFRSRVFGIAFTDSVHSFAHQLTSSQRQDYLKWFKAIARNWVSSKLPLDTESTSRNFHFEDCPRVSAGTIKHEETSWYAINSVFKFLQERLEKAVKRDRKKPDPKSEL